jgi:hypothetical protein
MNGTPEQNTDGYQQLSNAVGPNPAPAIPNLDIANSMVATPGGILLPQTSGAAPSPALTAPGASSPTNAAPARDWHTQLGAAAQKLMIGGMDPLNALVAGGVHALANLNKPAPSDTPAPSNTTWDAAQSNADASRPTTAPPPQPSNANKIIHGVEANLGDLAAATEGGTAGGGIAGAFRVAKASTTRQREEQENNIKMAHANAQMLSEQQLLHKTGEDAINASLAIGKQSADEMLAAPHAETIASGKDSDELKKMIDNKVVDPSKDAVFLTGRTLTGTDKNGLPMYRSTYSVIKPGDRLAPSAENIQFLNKYLPGQDFKEPDEDGKGGQTFDSHTYYMLNQRAMNRFADVQAIAKNTAETDDKVHKALLEKGSQELSGNQYVQAAIRDVAPVKGGDPFLFQKAFNILAREAALDPNIAKQLPKNWQQQFAYTYGGGEAKKFEDQMTQLSKLQEKAQDTQNDMLDIAMNKPSEMEGHTPAFQAALTKIANDVAQTPERRQKAKDLLGVVGDIRAGELQMEKDKALGKKEGTTGFVGDPDATTPEAFLSSLAPPEQSIVKMMGTGKMTLTRMEYLASRKPEVLEAVARAYPDFDQSKVAGYVNTYKEFTSSKPSTAGGALNAGGTALKHLNELQQLNTIKSRVPGTTDYNAFENKLDTLTGELATFYQMPKTEKTIQDMRSTLGAFTNRDAAISEQVKSMGDKLDSFEQTWSNAAPSKSYEAPMPYIDNKAKQARARLDPEYAKRLAQETLQQQMKNAPAAQQQQQPQTTSSQTAGGGVIVQTPDGPMSFKNQQAADAFKLKFGIK